MEGNTNTAPMCYNAKDPKSSTTPPWKAQSIADRLVLFFDICRINNGTETLEEKIKMLNLHHHALKFNYF